MATALARPCRAGAPALASARATDPARRRSGGPRRARAALAGPAENGARGPGFAAGRLSAAGGGCGFGSLSRNSRVAIRIAVPPSAMQ